jgi:hypothetical protein
MQFAFRLLIALVGLSPLFLISDSLLVQGSFAAFISVTMIIVAWSIRPGEADYLSIIVRSAAALASIPAIWISIQLLPMPIGSVQHPIWASAQAALSTQPLGKISIDPGNTLIALTRYFSAGGLFFVATAVTIDRRRAEITLMWLAAIVTLTAAVLIIHDLVGFSYLGEINSIGPRASITAAATLGTVLTAATIIYAIERYETRRSRSDVSWLSYGIIIVAAFFGFALCWVAILLFIGGPSTFAATCGFGTLILIVGLRRAVINSRLALAIVAVAFVVALAAPFTILSGTASSQKLDLTLRFDASAPQQFIELTQRIASDTNWFGSGAGSFPTLIPIYQASTDTLTAATAPTTAAEILIDLGHPALWIAVIMVIGITAWFIRGALERGRDSFFPTAAAGCLVVLAIEAFFDASLFGSTTIVFAMTILGLGLSQSMSRSIR